LQRGFWYGNLREGDHAEDIIMAEKIVLKWMFKKSIGRA